MDERCEALIWPRGGRRPCGKRARFETVEIDPITDSPVQLCGTHANSWSLQGHKVRSTETLKEDENG